MKACNWRDLEILAAFGIFVSKFFTKKLLFYLFEILIFSMARKQRIRVKNATCGQGRVASQDTKSIR